MIKVIFIKWFLLQLLLTINFVDNRKCIPKSITIKQCENKFYNYTSLPNMMGQDQDTEIQIRIDTYNSLLSNECSKELNFLLCSVYVPFCDFDTKIQLGPCRNVCEKVQLECEPLLRMFNLSWPEKLNCSRFPTDNSDGMQCMHKRKDKIQSPTIQLTELRTIIKNHPNNQENNIHGHCRHLRFSEKYVFINRTGRCALKCMANDLFTKESKHVADIWMSIIASLTFISTLFTCVTFCHNNRIRYPEQPIIFLTFSYNIYSLSMLLRLFLGRSKVSCDYDHVSGQNVVIQEGLENTYCAITFLLNFFFSTATHMWWIMLSLCWTLYCALNVSSSSLAKNSGIFHLFVWLMTSVLTVSVLILRSVDADELFGLCSVGEQSPDLLLTFSIIPKIICLIIGFVFLVAGFIFVKYRTKKLNKNNEKYYQHKVTYILSIGFRLGLFSIIYIVAIFALICCELYQYFNYYKWLRAPKIFEKRNEPIVAIFLLKLFMGQVVGINSAIWIWSLDAAGSWRKFFKVSLERFKNRPKNASLPNINVNESVRKFKPMESGHYCHYHTADH